MDLVQIHGLYALFGLIFLAQKMASNHGKWRNEALKELKQTRKGTNGIMGNNIMTELLFLVGEEL